MEQLEPTNLPTYRVVPLVSNRRRRLQLTSLLNLPKIHGVIFVTGLLLGRAVLLTDLHPFGVAFVAAHLRMNGRTNASSLLGVLLGVITLRGVMESMPYMVLLTALWYFGPTGLETKSRVSWLLWIAAGFVAVKAPLAFLLQGSVMVWMVSAVEAILAVVSFSLFCPVVESSGGERLASRELQMILLLVAIILGFDLIVFDLSLRYLAMLYLVLAAARIGGVYLSTLVASSLVVICMLLQLPVSTASLLVTIAVLAGALRRIPGGLLLGGVVGGLLAASVPIRPESVAHLLLVVTAGCLVYLTPAEYLKRLERVIPGTDQYRQYQESHGLRVARIVGHKVEQFSTILEELAKMVQGQPAGFLNHQLSGFSRIVQQLGRELKTDVSFSEAAEATLLRNLDAEPLQQLTVIEGCDGYEIHGARNDVCGERWCEHVARTSESVLIGNFQVAAKRCQDDGRCGFHISPKPRYRLDVCTAKVSQEYVSGDSDTVFELSTGKRGVVLSDGMGVGCRAAQDSTATIALLEKMIRAGYERELAVSIINQALLSRNKDETFATIDLVVVDLQNGQLEFVKIGAAASFIKRDDGVEIIQNHSLPVGILNDVDVDVEPDRRLLKEGEFLVMVTDGVLEAQRHIVERDEWMCRLLRRAAPDLDCQGLADYLLAHGLEATGGRVKDDMMVLVARLIRDDDEIYSYRGNHQSV